MGENTVSKDETALLEATLLIHVLLNEFINLSIQKAYEETGKRYPEVETAVLLNQIQRTLSTQDISREAIRKIVFKDVTDA
jgi:hypothetical protein